MAEKSFVELANEAAQAGARGELPPAPDLSSGRRGSFYIDEHDSGRLKPLTIFGGLDSSIDFTIENNELAGTLKSLPRSTSLRIFDEAMKTGLDVPTGRNFSLLPGQRMVIHSGQEEQFYQVTKTEADELYLTRETVRPQQTIAHDSKENFVVNIHDGRAFINGDSVRQDVYLTDENVQTNISKRGKELVINGNEVKGKHHEIAVGEETVHLVDTGQGWELVNEAMFAAKYPNQTKEKAGGADWNRPAAGLFKELGILGDTLKPRNWRDVFTLTTRAVSEVGGPVGTGARVALMLSNLAFIVIKEGLTYKQLQTKLNEPKFLTYLKQTALGKILTDQSEKDLYLIDKINAVAIGAGLTTILLAGGKGISAIIPGSSAWEILLNRGLFSYVLPRVATYAGRKLYETVEPEKAKEWTELTLGIVSATVTTLVTAGFIWDVGGELVGKLSRPVAATGTALIPPTEVVPPTPTEAPTQTPSPTEVVPPTPEFSWSPGIAIDKSWLQRAADQNYGWGIDVDQDGKADFQVFWLDQNTGPDVIVDTDNNHFIRVNDRFYLDFDKDGVIDDTELRGFWKLGDFDSKLQSLDALNQTEAPNLPEKIDGTIDITSGDIAKAGAVHLASLALSPALSPEADAPLPPNIDLNNDTRADLAKDDQGYFADNNYDGVYTKEVDTRITDLEFDQINWQADKIVYADGSMWLRNDDELVGILPDGRQIRLDDSSGTSRLQVQMHQENPAWSPQYVGMQAVINPENLAIPPAPIVPPAATEPLPETVTKTEYGSWHESGGKQWGIKLNGDRVWLTPEEGGIHGVLQLEMHNAHPDLDPELITRAAHLVIVENKDEVEAFRQPVDDGTAVAGAVADPTVVQMINQQIAIVSVERFLEANQNWLKNNHFSLSDKERYEVAKLAAPHWADWDDDDEIKAGLLNLIPGVEANPKYD